MQQNTPDQNYYQEDEIDLKQLFRSLADRKWFIFGFTGLVTALAIAYALSIPPTYKASISFLSPGKSSVIQLNKIKLSSETSETIYRNFLNNMIASKSQRDAFVSGNYLDKLNIDSNNNIVDIDNFIGNFAKSIQIEPTKKTKDEVINYEKPIIIAMEGEDPEVISSYLNDLASSADKRTINDFLTIIQQKIDIRLEEISKQRSLLLSSAKRNRLSKIKRIKIEDVQKINEINDQINSLRVKTKKERLDKITRIEKGNQLNIEKIIDQINSLRVKTKKERLNRIQLLSDAALIAGSLGIIDNNFQKISNNKDQDQIITIEIDSTNKKFPKWYLYGNKALSKEISILKNRTNDDPYIPEIVNLQNQIRTFRNDKDVAALKNRTNDDPYVPEIIGLQNKLFFIKSNQVLRTLESREDDSPFIVEINKLDIEAIELKSFQPNSSGINAMELNHRAYPPKTPIKPKKKLIVAVAFTAGFILSIFLVFIMNAFRKEEDKVVA